MTTTSNHENGAVCDTVKLILNVNDFKILESEAFTPAAHTIFTAKRSCCAVQNPDKQKMKAGHYQPCLTLKKLPRPGGMITVLLVAASLPKLVLGSNISEISDRDFPEVIRLLVERLAEMHVRVHPKVLEEAQVCKIDYCKNVILPENVACSYLLRDIEHADISRYLDTGRSDYRNEGHCIRFHSNGKEIALYDKVKDYLQGLKSEKRAIDNDAAFQNIPVKELAKMQILRLENRFSNGKEISKILEKIGMEPKDHRFCRLFDSRINQKVNTYIWEKIRQAVQCNHLQNEDPAALFKKLLTRNKWLKSLEIFGLVQLLKMTGVRDVKNLIPRNATSHKLFAELKMTEATSEWLDNIYNYVEKEIKENKNLLIRGR